MGDLRDEASSIAEEGMDRANSAYERGKAGVHRAAQRLREGAASGADTLRSAADSAVDQTYEAAHMVEHEIRARPLLYLAGAFGLGFLVGRLMDYSRSRRW